MSLATRNIVRAADEWKSDAMAMQTPPPSTDPTLDNLGRAPFGLMDILRRAQGDAFGAFGLDPSECPYRVIARVLLNIPEKSEFVCSISACSLAAERERRCGRKSFPGCDHRADRSSTFSRPFHDADKLAGVIYHRNRADPSVDKRFSDLLNRRLGLHRNHRSYHYIPGFHRFPHSICRRTRLRAVMRR